MKNVPVLKNAIKPIGPYNTVTEANGFYFISGQIPISSNGEIVGDNITSQTKQVLNNIDTILKDLDLKAQHVVKTTIYLKNMQDFSNVNAIYGNYFSENYPARSTVEVSGLPKDVLIEIECIAIK